MKTTAPIVRRARENTGSSLRSFAARVGTSAATLSDYENGKKEPTLSTLRRILERAGMEWEIVVTPRLTVTERLSLELHRRVADHLREEPTRVLALANKNLAALRNSGAAEHGMPYIKTWEAILAQPVEVICEDLVSTDQPMRDLRSVSPFGGVLSETERLGVIERFGWAAERRGACEGTSSST